MLGFLADSLIDQQGLLHTGDIILEANGKRIRTPEELMKIFEGKTDEDEENNSDNKNKSPPNNKEPANAAKHSSAAAAAAASGSKPGSVAQSVQQSRQS